MLQLTECNWNGTTVNIKSTDLVLKNYIITNSIVAIHKCKVFFENCTIKNSVIVMNGIMHMYDTVCTNSNFIFKELNRIDFRNSSFIDTFINISHEEKSIVCVDSCTFIGIPFKERSLHKCDFTFVNNLCF